MARVPDEWPDPDASPIWQEQPTGDGTPGRPYWRCAVCGTVVFLDLSDPAIVLMCPNRAAHGISPN